MLKDLFKLSVSPFELAIRAVVVYFFILILLRLGGKRQLGQMSPTEFVAILLISNAVQNAMNAGDNSLAGGLLLAVILVAASWLISVFTFHSPRARTIFEGTPTLLIHKGKAVEKNMIKERLTHQELKTLLRKQGVQHIDEIYSAILEADGALSLTRVSELSAQSGEKDKK